MSQPPLGEWLSFHVGSLWWRVDGDLYRFPLMTMIIYLLAIQQYENRDLSLSNGHIPILSYKRRTRHIYPPACGRAQNSLYLVSFSKLHPIYGGGCLSKDMLPLSTILKTKTEFVHYT